MLCLPPDIKCRALLVEACDPSSCDKIQSLFVADSASPGFFHEPEREEKAEFLCAITALVSVVARGQWHSACTTKYEPLQLLMASR